MQLTTIPEGLLQGLTSLGELNLSNNLLQTLPENLFQGLTSTRLYLYLSGNNFSEEENEKILENLSNNIHAIFD